MTRENAEEFTQSLGQILAGGWRQVYLADRIGVPKALGLTLREWTEQRLGGYIRLSASERREAIKELIDEGFSQRHIADVLGVSQKTVDRDTESNDSTNTEKAVINESNDSIKVAEPFTLTVAMRYAEQAISSLECITLRDGERLAAFKTVAQWIKQKTSKKQWKEIVT